MKNPTNCEMEKYFFCLLTTLVADKKFVINWKFSLHSFSSFCVNFSENFHLNENLIWLNYLENFLKHETIFWHQEKKEKSSFINFPTAFPYFLYIVEKKKFNKNLWSGKEKLGKRFEFHFIFLHFNVHYIDFLYSLLFFCSSSLFRYGVKIVLHAGEIKNTQQLWFLDDFFCIFYSGVQIWWMVFVFDTLINNFLFLFFQDLEWLQSTKLIIRLVSTFDVPCIIGIFRYYVIRFFMIFELPLQYNLHLKHAGYGAAPTFVYVIYECLPKEKFRTSSIDTPHQTFPTLYKKDTIISNLFKKETYRNYKKSYLKRK